MGEVVSSGVTSNDFKFLLKDLKKKNHITDCYCTLFHLQSSAAPSDAFHFLLHLPPHSFRFPYFPLSLTNLQLHTSSLPITLLFIIALAL